jgi:hypothetical protein
MAFKSGHAEQGEESRDINNLLIFDFFPDDNQSRQHDLFGDFT